MSGSHALVAVPLALGAAASFAVSNVAQMDAVTRRKHPGGSSVEVGLLLRLVRDPLWLAGLLASVLGFVFEAFALSMAPVVLVQPLIVAELPFALPIAALAAGKHLGAMEWRGVVLVTGGLMALVGVIRPQDAPIVGSAALWAVLFASVATALLVLVAIGSRFGGVGRTTAYAAAAGATFGLLSVVTKAVTQDVSAHGVGAIFTWQPWALAAVGLTGMTIAQNSYRAGPLAVSLPLLDVGEPLVGSLIAVFAFGEKVGGLSPSRAVVLGLAALALVGGVATLDRSPLVQAASPGGPGVARPDPDVDQKPATR